MFNFIAIFYVEYYCDATVDNLNVVSMQAVIQPQLLLEEVPATQDGQITVRKARSEIRNILDGADDRVTVIVGPCSIHDVECALEYAQRLAKLKEELKDDIQIVMRVYFEKPRTTVGWKGLFSDPFLDDSCKINQGLRIARKLLVDINTIGLPVAVEFLDSMVPQYIADQVCWGAIGARTVESQLHRQLAAGLSMPVGFKNGTTGDVQVAVDACRAANHPHSFLGITKQGLPAIIHSSGNQYAHVILRGGQSGTNFDATSVRKAAAAMEKVGLLTRVVVDASHGNCNKDFRNQPKVVNDICSQIASGSQDICGIMIESNLEEGNQPIPSLDEVRSRGCKSVLECLRKGVSVTDACISWDTTVEVLGSIAKAIRQRRALYSSATSPSTPSRLAVEAAASFVENNDTNNSGNDQIASDTTTANPQ